MDYKEFVKLFNPGYVPKINNYKEFVKLFNSGYVPELTAGERNIFFRSSCSKGHIKVAKWLHDISGNKIYVSAGGDGIFQWTCYKGHLDVVKWLWEISGHKIDICAGDYWAFRHSCKNDQLVVAKWLWIISKCTIAFSALKKYSAKLAFLNLHSIKKYRYKYISTYDNLHMLHHYYKPVDGPGYLHAINDKN